MDSNHQYRVSRSRVREGVMSAPLDSSPTERQQKRRARDFARWCRHASGLSVPKIGRLVTLFYHSATGDGATSGLTATETMRCGHYTPATAECRAAWRHRTHWVMVQ